MTKSNVMNRFLLKGVAALSLLLLVVFLSGCIDEQPASPQLPVGFVSIYHGAPDAPAVNIMVDNQLINRNPFEYSDYSGYLNFFTGERNLKFSAVGASSVLTDTTFSVVDGKAYSVFLINGDGNPETLVVRDSAATPATGKAMLRFVHLSPDASTLHIVDGEGAVLFEGADFREATDFKEVEAGIYSFNAVSSSGDGVSVVANNVDVNAGGYYTIVIRGFATPPAGNANVLSLEVF